jgi:NAD(P)-dependent dehydrogenase (short-subunit alcohol dehydrogenase family)
VTRENEILAPPESFSDRVAIVTGGSSGIGLATVEELCNGGARVAFSSYEEELGKAVEDRLLHAGHQALFCHGDMSDEQFCRQLVDRTIEKWGDINLLVNNAFSFIAKGLDATTEDWERTMRVGPIGYARMAQFATPYLQKRRHSAVVNVSSVSAFVSQPNRWTYNSAKGAVETLTKCMALDLAPLGIRVNSVSPGWIWTREVAKAAQNDRQRWEPVWGNFHMMRRFGEPVEVARAILFLLSPAASFITAADLPVDGGYLGMGSEGLGLSTTFVGSQ